jgi:hypothetical protein
MALNEIGQFFAQIFDLAAQARNTSAAEGLSSMASSRCSTVMNSWRFCRASIKAICKLTSNSWAIIDFPPSRIAADAGGYERNL